MTRLRSKVSPLSTNVGFWEAATRRRAPSPRSLLSRSLGSATSLNPRPRSADRRRKSPPQAPRRSPVLSPAAPYPGALVNRDRHGKGAGRRPRSHVRSPPNAITISGALTLFRPENRPWATDCTKPAENSPNALETGRTGPGALYETARKLPETAGCGARKPPPTHAQAPVNAPCAPAQRSRFSRDSEA